MTVLFVVTLAGLAILAGWLWRLSRDVGSLQRTEARVDDRLHDAWEHIGRSHGEHTWHVGQRIQRVDDAIARVADRQRRLDERLDVVEQWVRHWAGQARR